MNLKWFSKNIKAVFAEEEAGGGKATPKQQLVKSKKRNPCSDNVFSLASSSGLGSGNGSGDVSIKKDL